MGGALAMMALCRADQRPLPPVAPVPSVELLLFPVPLNEPLGRLEAPLGRLEPELGGQSMLLVPPRAVPSVSLSASVPELEPLIVLSDSLAVDDDGQSRLEFNPPLVPLLVPLGICGDAPMEPLPGVLDWAKAAPAVRAITEAAARIRRVIPCAPCLFDRLASPGTPSCKPNPPGRVPDDRDSRIGSAAAAAARETPLCACQ